MGCAAAAPAAIVRDVGPRAGRLGRLTLLWMAVAAGACLTGAMVVRSKGPIALGTMSVVSLGIVLALIRVYSAEETPDDRARTMRWTLVAFGAHLLAGLVISQWDTSVRFFGGDAVTYHLGAEGIMRHWTDGEAMPRLPNGREGFYYLLAGLYWVFGPYTGAGLALNAAFAAGLIPVVSDTTRRLFGPLPVRFVAPLLLFLPGLFVWTSQLLKEAPILFLIAVGVNCAVRLTDRLAVGWIVLLAGIVAVLLTFRGHVAFFIAVGLFAGLILGRAQLLSGVATGAVVLATMALVVLGSGVGESGFETVTTSDLVQANSVRQGLAYNTGSGFGADVDISTSRRAIAYLPLGLVNFLLGPFPWQLGGTRQLVALPDVLATWWLIPSLVLGYRQARAQLGRKVRVLLLPAALVSAVLALVISNYGTVVREREQVVVMLVPLVALGLAARAAGRAGEAEPLAAQPLRAPVLHAAR